MTWFRVFLMVATLAALPVGEVMAQNNPLASQWRQDRAREESREGQRISMREVTARVSAGRPGRLLGVSERGSGGRLVYVVRWEYPGGRVADISIDGRTGRILGER